MLGRKETKNKGNGIKIGMCSRKHHKKISFLIILLLIGSLLYPTMGDGVQAKSKICKNIIIGGSSKALIAKSKKNTIYTYRSSNAKVAKVSANGVVTGKKKGRATVVRYVTKRKKTKIDKVITYKVEKFKMTGLKTIYTSGTYTYKTNGTNVKWSIDSKKCATISKKGILKANKVGTVIITAKSGKKKVKKKLSIKKDEIDHITVEYINPVAYQGNQVTKSDLKVYAIYKSGKKEELTNYTITQNGLDKNGTNSICISYGSFTASTPVVAKEKKVTDLQIKYEGKGIAVNQSVSESDFTVTVVYNDGSTTKLTNSEFSLKNNTAKQRGTLSVIVIHKASGVQKSVVVPVTGLSIQNVQADYTEDIIYTEDGIDLSKIKILITYEDGTQGYVDPNDMRVGETVLENGKRKVIIYYTVNGQEYSTMLEIAETSRKLDSLVVEPELGVAYCGKELNREQFSVKACYKDGVEKIITDWTCDYRVVNEIGEQKVVFQYMEDDVIVDAIVPIAIKEDVPVAIRVVKIDESITEGMPLDKDNMEVEAVYEDGTKERVYGFKTDYNEKDGALGNRQVTVTYMNLTATVTVEVVKKKLVAIEVTPPSGITYKGSAMNTAGMSVIAVYNNNSKETVSGWTSDYSTALAEGTHTIIVSYGGLSSTMMIQVENALSVSLAQSTTIEGHPVAITANKSDLQCSVVSGNGSVSNYSGTYSVTPSSPGTVVVKVVRIRTGETKQLTLNATAFTLTYTNQQGGNACIGDHMIFTSNTNVKFSYTFNANDGMQYTSNLSTQQTRYEYVSKKTGTLLLKATDPVSGRWLEKSVIVRKELNISGSSSVKVGKTITLTSTKDNVTWSSSNKAVATISTKGVVKGIKAGTVTITATFPDYGNRKLTKKITVTN